jgi:hypothetical protein
MRISRIRPASAAAAACLAPSFANFSSAQKLELKVLSAAEARSFKSAAHRSTF